MPLLFIKLQYRKIGAERVFLRQPRFNDWAERDLLWIASRDFLSVSETGWARENPQRGRFFGERQSEAMELFIYKYEDGKLLGEIRIEAFEERKSCRLGFWVGVEYAGLGYMTEAIGVLKTYLFESGSFQRLEAVCSQKNQASIGLLRKVGFQKRKNLPNYLLINGVWENHELLAVDSANSP